MATKKAATKKAATKKAPAKKAATKKDAATKKAAPARPRKAGKVVLLSGGRPQIAKGDGDGPVQEYLAALPGWKSGVGRRLDALIERTIPGVHKAVRWNTPFYGVEDGLWILALGGATKYLQVSFFRGTSLDPPPPVGSKTPETRYLNIYEDEPLDEAQFVAWVTQASRLPGDKL